MFMLMTIYECILIIEFVCVLLDFTQKKNLYCGFLDYDANAHNSWFLMKGAPPVIVTTTKPLIVLTLFTCSRWIHVLFHHLVSGDHGPPNSIKVLGNVVGLSVFFKVLGSQFGALIRTRSSHARPFLKNGGKVVMFVGFNNRHFNFDEP